MSASKSLSVRMSASKSENGRMGANKSINRRMRASKSLSVRMSARKSVSGRMGANKSWGSSQQLLSLFNFTTTFHLFSILSANKAMYKQMKIIHSYCDNFSIAL